MVDRIDSMAFQSFANTAVDYRPRTFPLSGVSPEYQSELIDYRFVQPQPRSIAGSMPVGGGFGGGGGGGGGGFGGPTGRQESDMERQKRLKQEHKRERNRQAAAKCRQKKLDRIDESKKNIRQLTDDNQRLTRIKLGLQREIDQLRHQLSDHRHCDGLKYGVGVDE